MGVRVYNITCVLFTRGHLCVLVVSWQGWPMSLGSSDRLGLKYSSAVRAAGLVTAGHDMWVTRACNTQGRGDSEG